MHEMLDSRLYDEDADALNLISDPFDDEAEAQIDDTNSQLAALLYKRCVQSGSR